MSDYRDPTPIDTKPTTKKIPEKIKKIAAYIRQKMYGRDVREAIAQGVEEAGAISLETSERQDHLETIFKDLIINAGESNAEVVASRKPKDAEESYPTLGDRLDAMDELNEQGVSLTNLFKGSDDWSGWHFTNSNSSLQEIINDNDVPSGKTVKIVSAVTGGSFFGAMQYQNLTVNTYYAITILAKSNKNGNNLRINQYGSLPYSADYTLTTNWQLYTYIFKATDFTQGINFLQSSSNVGTELYLASPMLVKGAKPIEYLPNFKTLNDRIAALEEKITVLGG